MTLRIKQQITSFEITFKTPRDCSVMVALLRRLGILVSNSDMEQQHSTLGVDHMALHGVQSVPRLSAFSNINQIADPHFIPSQPQSWLVPSATQAHRSITQAHHSMQSQVTQSTTPSFIGTQALPRPEYNPYNIFLARGTSQPRHVNSPLWQSHGYSSPNGPMSDMSPLVLPAMPYNHIALQQNRQAQTSSLPATQQIPCPVLVQPKPTMDPLATEETPEPRNLPFRVASRIKRSADREIRPGTKDPVMLLTSHKQDKVASDLETNRRTRRCIQRTISASARCTPPENTGPANARLATKRKPTQKKAAITKPAKKAAGPAKPCGTPSTRCTPMADSMRQTKMKHLPSASTNVISTPPLGAENGSLLPNMVERDLTPEPTQQQPRTTTTERVLLADAAALRQVNIATAALLEQYRLDARDTAAKVNLAAFYCERIAEARQQAWMSFIICKEPTGINDCVRATESFPL